MTKFKKHVLPNGLRVIFAPQAGSTAATVLVLVEAGSKYETKEINGISHFLEHLCFKGTKKRPQPSVISTELDTLGASNNAFTGHEMTGYYAKVNAKKARTALEIIADLYVNPIFDAAELEKEKGVIIEEINMYEDMPMRKVAEVFPELMYGDQPAGWPIGGLKDVIRRLTREEIVAYRSKHYVAEATVVVVAGAFNEKQTLADIKKLFAHIATDKKSGKLKTIEAQTSPQSKVLFKESDQTHLILGFRAFDMYDKRRHALEVLGDILGSGMSSRLFRLLREELGAAYYVNAGLDLFTDHGFLAAAAGIDHKKLSIVVNAILGEFKKLKTELVSKEELTKAKNHMTGKLMLNLETSDELASFYGDQELFKMKIKTPDQVIKQIQGVTPQQIREVARTVIQGDRLNFAMIGPFKELPADIRLAA